MVLLTTTLLKFDASTCNRRAHSDNPILATSARLDLEEGLGGESEKMALFLPVMRQVFAQPQEPGQR